MEAYSNAKACTANTNNKQRSGQTDKKNEKDRQTDGCLNQLGI